MDCLREIIRSVPVVGQAVELDDLGDFRIRPLPSGVPRRCLGVHGEHEPEQNEPRTSKTAIEQDP